MKKSKKTLSLTKQTVSKLNDQELNQVVGGSSWACIATGIAANALYEFGNGVYEGFRDAIAQSGNR